MSDAPVAPPSPPRAFTQGVGTVFQFTGGVLFLVMTFICCASSLLGKETAERPELTRIGWHLSSDPPTHPTYSAQRAISVALVVGIVLGLALSAAGLGLQATHPSAAIAAVLIAPVGAVFWIVHLVFAILILHSILLCVFAGVLLLIFLTLTILSIGALREMRSAPPPAKHDVIPPGQKIPYSWYHEDPPEVRLAQELEARRQRLAAQQKELELLEDKLRKSAEENKAK